MRTKLRLLGKAVGFCSLLVLTLLAVSFVFLPKNNHQAFGVHADEAPAGGIQGEPENSIDVLVLGDSEAYSSISPMQLWDTHGFTSYLCSTSGQPLYDSYRLLRQSLERQRPKVVILETNAIFRPYTLRDAIFARAGMLFSVLRYHDRWKDLHINDLRRPSSTWTDDFKGYRYNPGVDPARTTSYMQPNGASEPIPTLNEICLQEMLTLCEQSGAQLTLVSTPSTINWNHARHESIAAFAKAYDLPYLDLNTLPDQIGIDWQTDTRDKGDHLNHRGAVKVTQFLGNYLTEHFDLPDHREEEAYAPWSRALARYQTIAR